MSRNEAFRGKRRGQDVELAVERRRLNIELVEEGSSNCRPVVSRLQELPCTRARSIQGEHPVRAQVEENHLVVESSRHDVSIGLPARRHGLIVANALVRDSVRSTMPNADFFSALGLFVRRAFIDPETSARLRTAVQAAPSSAATVRTEEGTYDVDRSTRSTDWAKVAPQAVELVQERLKAIMPEVAKQYGVPLTGFQSLQFLVYREGDFFERHRDRDEGEDASDFSRARQVSAVIFLNGVGDPAAEGFRGGALTLYGLFDQPDSEAIGFPLEAEEGLLITFPAGTAHEVRPVEAGERYTVVTWFE